MADDVFFNAVGKQLLKLPAASRQAVDEVAKGVPVAPMPFAVPQSRSWAEDLLQDPFQPPAAAPFAAIIQEEGVCDVVRSVFEVEKWKLHIAQTRYLISIRIDDPPIQPGATADVTANTIAKKILTMPDRIRLIRVGAYGKGSYGTQDPAAPRVDPDWPHWLDCLRWWYEAPNVGFLTLKASGGPTKEILTPAEGQNRKWFTK